MVSREEVERQLKRLGISRPRLARAEFRELPNIIMPGEVIEKLVVGIYVGGYAILVATNKRMLVIDKMPGSLIVEDIPYDMISEVEFTYSMMKTQVVVFCRSKTIKFSTIRRPQLRDFAEFLEKRMMEVRRVLPQKFFEENTYNT